MRPTFLAAEQLSEPLTGSAPPI